VSSEATQGPLARLLDVQARDENVFVGDSEHLGFRALFGGQVLGQALVAAARTVTPDRPAHSLHAYFLRPGNPEEPVRYEVELTRTGASFSTRRVAASQGSTTIFSMIASFQRPETSYTHAPSMPKVAGPDGLTSDKEAIRKLAHVLPPKSREKLTADYHVEIRTSDRPDYARPEPRPAQMHSWMRVRECLPDDPVLHQGALAYASDFGISTVSLLPHGVNLLSPGLHIASLDHAMWFHHPHRWEDWLLYAKDSPIAAGARGLNRGQIFDANGRLVATVAQESLIRQAPPA
jgi:acyl-CoA thioesterase-2